MISISLADFMDHPEGASSQRADFSDVHVKPEIVARITSYMVQEYEAV